MLDRKNVLPDATDVSSSSQQRSNQGSFRQDLWSNLWRTLN